MFLTHANGGDRVHCPLVFTFNKQAVVLVVSLGGPVPGVNSALELHLVVKLNDVGAARASLIVVDHSNFRFWFIGVFLDIDGTRKVVVGHFSVTITWQCWVTKGAFQGTKIFEALDFALDIRARLNGGDLLGPGVHTIVKFVLGVLCSSNFVLERKVGELEAVVFLAFVEAELHVASLVMLKLIDSAAVSGGIAFVFSIKPAEETSRGVFVVVCFLCIAELIVFHIRHF